MAEYDAPKNSMILAMVIGTVASLIVVVLGIAQFFDIAVRDEIQDKTLSQPSSALRDLRALEQDRLSRYAWVDQKAGVVRLPIERAAELTLRDWEQRPQGLTKPEETPPPSPAAASAPAPASAPASAPAAGSAPASAPAPGSAPAPAPGSAPASIPATLPKPGNP